jgi:hypothetical protein
MSCAGNKKSQSFNCNGDILQVGLSIRGQASCSHCVIEKEFLKNGFSLVLEDTAYKIYKFTISYSNADKLLFKREIQGDRVHEKNVKFLRSLKDGDVISINCVYILKNKETSLSTSMLIVVR